RADFLAELAERAEELGVRPRVHVKYDSGMGRLGERDPEVVRDLVDSCAGDDRVELVALWTHFATADEEDQGFLRDQLARFTSVADGAREQYPDLKLHAANSAATLCGAEFHFDMVRCGIAIYGLDPFGRDAADWELEPVLSLHSYVADVKRLAVGESVGYGRSWSTERETLIGVVPVGYGDGVRRGLSNRCDVLVGGSRTPVVGTISMDNLTLDLGPDSSIEPGEPVILIGAQGGERVTAEDWARSLETINYEISCGISPRVPRAYRR
nr:alanine racemase [Solirubrobacterales bacterium]